jgi:hypothetical protein
LNKLQTDEVTRLGNELEKVVTDHMVKQKPTVELAVGSIAGLCNIVVCTAFALWGPEFGLECITKSINAAAKVWKQKEDKKNEGGGGETKVRNKP